MIKLAAPFLLLLGAVLLSMALEQRLPRADVVVSQTQDCFTLDPQRMSYMHDLRMARSLYEGLVRRNNQTGAFTPGMAESWESNEDGTEWIFKIRESARWSNGDPVTPEDFVYAWRRALMPDTAADYTDLFFAIEGAEEFFNRRMQRTTRHPTTPYDNPREQLEGAKSLLEETLVDFQQNVGLTALDDHTLEVRLKLPLAYFLDLCAFSVFAPVHSELVEKHVSLDPDTGMIVQDHGWTRAGTLISNGPFKLERRRIKHDIRIERNPYYWNQEVVMPDSVEVVCIEDPNTSVLAFEVGSVDWVSEVSAEYLADMMDEQSDYITTHGDQYQESLELGSTIDEALAALPEPNQKERRDLHTNTAFGTFFFGFNCRPTLGDGSPNPLHDPRVRKALAMAIDKEVIVEKVLRTNEPVAGSLVPPGSIPGYTPPAGTPHDPEEAKRLLESAGWIDRNGDSVPENERGEVFPPIDLLYTTGTARYQDMALSMREMWKAELGIETNLRSKDTKSYRADLKQGNFMVARGGWYGDYGDPMTFLELSETGTGNNDRKYSNALYDDLLQQARQTADLNERTAMLHEAERMIIQDDHPILPLYHYTTTYLYDPTRIRGLSRHPRLQQEYWQLEVLNPSSTGPPEAE